VTRAGTFTFTKGSGCEPTRNNFSPSTASERWPELRFEVHVILDVVQPLLLLALVFLMWRDREAYRKVPRAGIIKSLLFWMVLVVIVVAVWGLAAR